MSSVRVDVFHFFSVSSATHFWVHPQSDIVNMLRDPPDSKRNWTGLSAATGRRATRPALWYSVVTGLVRGRDRLLLHQHANWHAYKSRARAIFPWASCRPGLSFLSGCVIIDSAKDTKRTGFSAHRAGDTCWIGCFIPSAKIYYTL